MSCGSFSPRFGVRAALVAGRLAGKYAEAAKVPRACGKLRHRLPTARTADRWAS
nr:hypothetical protein [Tanacetum cinerariifolium]